MPQNPPPPSPSAVQPVPRSPKRKELPPSPYVFETPAKRKRPLPRPENIHTVDDDNIRTVVDVFRFVSHQLKGKPVEFHEDLLQKAILKPSLDVALQMIEHTYEHWKKMSERWKVKLQQASAADILPEDRNIVVKVIDDEWIPVITDELEQLRAKTPQRNAGQRGTPARRVATQASESIRNTARPEKNKPRQKQKREDGVFVPSEESSESEKEEEESPESEKEEEDSPESEKEEDDSPESEKEEEEEPEQQDEEPEKDRPEEEKKQGPTEARSHDDTLSEIRKALETAAKSGHQDLEGEETKVWRSWNTPITSKSQFASLCDSVFTSFGTHSRIKVMLKHCMIACLIHSANDSAVEAEKQAMFDWLSQERKIDASLRSKYAHLYNLIHQRYAAKMSDLAEMSRLPFVRADVKWTTWRSWMTAGGVRRLVEMMDACGQKGII